MIRRLEFDGLGFLDANGTYRVIYGVSLKKRRELAHALQQLSDRLSHGHYKTVGDLYDYDVEFRAIADFCLKLNGIDPSWLNAGMLTEFVLPHRDKDGKPQKPLLEQLNFPPPPEGEEAKPHSYTEAIAALWTHTNTLREALDAAGYDPDEFPAWKELQDLLVERNKLIDPKAKEEAEMEKVAKEIEKSMEDGTWFSGFGGGIKTKTKIASPQETDQMLRSLLTS